VRLTVEGADDGDAREPAHEAAVDARRQEVGVDQVDSVAPDQVEEGGQVADVEGASAREEHRLDPAGLELRVEPVALRHRGDGAPAVAVQPSDQLRVDRLGPARSAGVDLRGAPWPAPSAS